MTLPATTAATLAALLASGATPDPRPAAAAPGGEAAAAEPGEEVVVTGTRSPRPTSSMPTSVHVLGADDVRDAAATTTDALLRALPSFQTFRRSTSLAADPSSQGLALRGIGPSAVSRTLLLDGGVPVNDPFGGWIPWRALPRIGLERVEVAPGGASALYGSFALGGVVALVPRPAGGGPAVEAEATGGELGTFSGALRAARRSGPVAATLEGDALRTDGHPVVAPWAAGPVDGRAGADHAAGTLRLRWDAAPSVAITGGVTAFAEDQDGGTVHTTSGMRSVAARTGLAWRSGDLRLEALVHGGARRFTQDRARVSPGRATEDLAARQRIPSRDLGASVVLSGRPVAAHALAAGADVRGVWGEAREDLFPPETAPDTAAVLRTADGAQVLGGAFLQDVWTAARGLEVAGALRLDGWRNAAARTGRATRGGAAVEERFPPRTATELSPRLAVLWRPAGALALRASAYRAFRAPTLNELYRTFQVGTVITAPDPSLRAERLSGAEAGPDVRLPGALRARATAFWNVLEDPSTIVTLDAPLEDGATRQRANLGRARIRGVETVLSWEPRWPVGATFAWTIADARVTAAPGHEDLVGKRLPQDPLHRVALDLGVGEPGRARAAVSFRWYAEQYEDDRNARALPAYGVVDLTAALPIGAGLEAFAAAENLLDRQYLVGRAGVDTVGAPRLVRAGVRLRVGGR
jgi:outer membrane receptor protein involved in Fe transport